MISDQSPLPGHSGRRLCKAPEVKQALAAAPEYAILAATTKRAEEREYYERRRQTWLGVADGWA